MRDIFRNVFVLMGINAVLLWPALSYADWNGHDWHGKSGGYHGGYHGGYGHVHSYVNLNLGVWPSDYYYAPYYYPPADVLVSPPPEVDETPAVVGSPPVQYVAQPVPEAAAITPAQTGNSAPLDSITVNIPDKKGGYAAVTIKRSGNGFTGPQGEFYTEFPKVAQLEVMYGNS